MAKKLKVLGVHGLGDHRTTPWEAEWREAIAGALDSDPATLLLEFEGTRYDPIFERTKISFAETMGALWKLGRSGFAQIGRQGRGIGDVADRIRWTAGYVVAWVDDTGFQAQTRKLVLDHVRAFKPDVILAHSLGSLITYNAFSHPDAAEEEVAAILRSANYVTLGSQIANPFVIGNLTHGRVNALAVRHWHHLYNEHDDVFTAPIRMPGVANFNQLLTSFDIQGLADHSAVSYLTHPTTVGSLWQPLALKTADAKVFRGLPAPWKRAPRTTRKTRRRALLVGINEYPRESDRLAGCVNDVFTMSAVLQECGFAPEEIRTCLDDRATASGILDRLDWLLGDVQSGDQRVFFYSGHGAQVPEYGEHIEPDRLTETLVPWDFDWSPQTCISDEQIFKFYSQLPYDSQLMMFFDCCHSGSMHRQSGAKARGISPPDDIRHRQLKWDIPTEMWVDRDFKRINPKFSPKARDNARFFGDNGATIRLGRAAMLRRETSAEFKAAAAASEGPLGPFLPLIVEACGEDQLSYEYRHGATSYGAFTFCLASILRDRRSITFEELVRLTAERLADLQYNQTPQLLGPTAVMKAEVPWNPAGTQPSRPRRTSVPGGATPRLSG
ncbi:caspase domain-containing protein [Hoeflea marina]|uniref:Caspase domain-containing protein n=1 Tax=Hoeflea marina TaxID=274592 RepID=A0A317PFI9_9HYPH|nr:caspase family protein [Hoeflea marina]PWV98794.1 caspase domain-containing protein [Hoeflea marina]